MPWRRPKSWRTAAITASTVPQFAPTFRQRAEKGDASARSWLLAGGFTSKFHCLADALRRPLAFHLTVGVAADCKAYDALIDLPERAPDALLADKGYDADAIRADLAERKIEAVIPGRSNRRVKFDYNRTLYKQRNPIERMFGQLKINHGIATRYDQMVNSCLGMVHLATARYWLKFVHAA
ncbi:MAG: IS5 family transposase [Novosphingobium sp.]